MTAGERIRKLREEKRLTQAQLAEAGGTFQSTIARIERDGTTDGLKVITLKRMADALGCSLDYLAGRRRVGFKTQVYDILFRSPRPLRVNDLWRKIEPSLRAIRPRGDVCIFVEQWMEGEEYATAVEVKQFRGTGLAKNRREQQAEAIVAEALRSPMDGCLQLEHRLREQGIPVSASTVQKVLRKKGLTTQEDRLRRKEEASMRPDGSPTT